MTTVFQVFEHYYFIIFLFFFFLHSVCVLFSIHASLPPEIRLSGSEFEMRGGCGSLSRRDRDHRALASHGPVQPRGYQMLMRPPVCMYSHVSSLQMCNTFITEAVLFSPVQHPSMVIRRDGPRRRAACEKGTEGEDSHY